MTDPTWGDFVRWCGRGRDTEVYFSHAAELVVTERDADIALAARGDWCSAKTKDLKDRFTSEHGAPADPPAVPHEKLLALAEELGKEADESKRVNRFDDDYSAAVAAAIALRSAESRLRAIIGVTEDAHG